MKLIKYCLPDDRQNSYIIIKNDMRTVVYQNLTSFTELNFKIVYADYEKTLMKKYGIFEIEFEKIEDLIELIPEEFL